jgi:hypothetical protein
MKQIDFFVVATRPLIAVTRLGSLTLSDVDVAFVCDFLFGLKGIRLDMLGDLHKVYLGIKVLAQHRPQGLAELFDRNQTIPDERGTIAILQF